MNAPATIGLGRHTGFRLLWVADTAARFGTAAATALLPLLAATGLHATAVQMGLLTAAEYVAFLLVGLPAGAWIDRARRRTPILVGADLIRAVLYLGIPGAAVAGVMTFGQLLVTAALAGLCTVFFDTAYQAHLPDVVGLDNLEAGYARLQSTQSISQAVGPGLGGLLAQTVGAAGGLVLTGVGYLASAALLARTQTTTAATGVAAAAVPSSDASRPRRLWREVGEGLRHVLGHRQLRQLTAASAIAAFGTGALLALEVLFMLGDLHLGSGGTGMLLALSGIGSVLGATMTGACTRRLGAERATWLVPLLTWPANLLLPLAWPAPGGWLLAGIGITVYAAGATSYNIVSMTRRQRLTADHLRGRVNASLRVAVWGTMPAGSLSAGILAGQLGQRPVLLGAVVITLAALIPAARSAR